MIVDIRTVKKLLAERKVRLTKLRIELAQIKKEISVLEQRLRMERKYRHD